MVKAAEKTDAAGVKPAPRPSVVGGTPRFSLTVFFYANIDGKRFPAQQTVSADSVDEFGDVLEAFYQAFVPQEGDAVVYEPREVGPIGGNRGSSNAAPQAPARPPVEQGPMCPIHQVPTTKKTNRTTGATFYSCSKRTADGYCNWRPPTESD